VTVTCPEIETEKARAPGPSIESKCLREPTSENESMLKREPATSNANNRLTIRTDGLQVSTVKITKNETICPAGTLQAPEPALRCFTTSATLGGAFTFCRTLTGAAFYFPSLVIRARRERGAETAAQLRATSQLGDDPDNLVPNHRDRTE
jgi:hypothetical protein